MAAILDTVRPGDVISSDLLNRIIALLNAHDALITAGGSSTSSDAVTISSFVPGPPFQAGQDLQIVGSNFGFSTGGTVLKFDSTQVNAFKLGSNDSLLMVNVPYLSGLGTTGKDVLMSLSNGSSTTARIVKVMPMQQQQQGNVDVFTNDTITPNPNPNPILNGQPLTLAYVIRSRTLLPATFRVAVQCSNAAMQTAVQVLDSGLVPIAGGNIDLSPGQQQGFFIRFPAVPVANGASFSLTVSATTPGVAGSDTRSFTVNVLTTTPDPTINLAFNAITATDPNTGTPDATANYTAGDATLHVRKNIIARVNLFSTFTQAGTYNVSVAAQAGTTNWSVVLADTPTQYVISAGDISAGGGSASRNPQIGVQGQPTASATGQVVLTIQRQGATQLRIFTLNLATMA